MDARSKERLKVAQTVLKSLRNQDFRSDMSCISAQGNHVVIPALPDDPMDQFFEDFRRAEGTVYIATIEGGELIVLSVSPAHAPRHAAPASDPCPIYPDTELGMVISYLKLRRAPLPFYQACKSVMLDLVDGEDLPTPMARC